MSRGIEMDPSEGFCRLGLVGDKAFLYTFKLIDKSMCMTDAKEVPLSNFQANRIYLEAED